MALLVVFGVAVGVLIGTAVNWIARRSPTALRVIAVVAICMVLGLLLAGCGPKADESSPCKGWESLPGATCNTT